MLTELYIEALLVDEDLADRVWELWRVGIIPDGLAEIAWSLLASRTAALPPKAAVGLISCRGAANDPKRTCIAILQ